MRRSRAVSYTHLDVYKRQVLDPPVVVAVGVSRAGIGIGFADDAFGDDSSGVAPVSYTHLDVYKRQLLRSCRS